MRRLPNKSAFITENNEKFEYEDVKGLNDDVDKFSRIFVKCELPRHGISGSLFVGRKTTIDMKDGVPKREQTETKIWVMEEDENVKAIFPYSKEQLATILAKRCKDFEAGGELEELIDKYSQY